MKINITLFIQIGNFLLTYYILKKVFFKPVIHSIEERKSTDANLSQKIKHEETEALNFKKTKDIKLHEFQDHYKTQILAHEEKNLTTVPVHEVPLEEISDAALKKLEQKARVLLIEKVPHGY